MHPSLSSTLINAHIRDLQRSMWPDRNKPRRFPRRSPRRQAR